MILIYPRGRGGVITMQCLKMSYKGKCKRNLSNLNNNIYLFQRKKKRVASVENEGERGEEEENNKYKDRHVVAS